MWTFASPRVFCHSLWCVFSLLFLFLIFHVFGFFPILFGLCLWIDVGFNSNTRVRLSFISLLTTHKSCVLFCEKKILDWFSLTFFFFLFFSFIIIILYMSFSFLFEKTFGRKFWPYDDIQLIFWSSDFRSNILTRPTWHTLAKSATYSRTQYLPFD